MSSNLWIEPAHRKRTSLSTELKFALRKRFYPQIVQYNADKTDLSYFQGLFDAGITDAKIVIDMINKHGLVVLNEEY